MKTQCLQTNKMQHYYGKESALEAGWVRKREALIKKFNLHERREKMRLRHICKRSTQSRSKLSADISH